MTTTPARGAGGTTLHIDGVSYRYPRFELGSVTLSLYQGDILGLVGPNGSGKTTLLDLVVGRRQPAEGRVRVMGDLDPTYPETCRLLGYAPDSSEELLAELTAVELWRIHALAHVGLERRSSACEQAATLAATLDFSPPVQPIASYSRGMKRKTQLVAAMFHEPPLVVLDEPTNGLDPLTSYRLGTHVEGLAAQGSSILVATHDLAWAQRFCNRIAAISNGKLMVIGDVDDVLPAGCSLLDQFMAIAESADPDASR